MPLKPKYMAFTATASSDAQFNLTTMDIWFQEIDIFVYTADADVGSIDNQVLALAADDVYTVRGPLNIRDLFFKNHAAGVNTTIAAGGTALNDVQLQQLGILEA